MLTFNSWKISNSQEIKIKTRGKHELLKEIKFNVLKHKFAEEDEMMPHKI